MCPCPVGKEVYYVIFMLCTISLNYMRDIMNLSCTNQLASTITDEWPTLFHLCSNLLLIQSPRSFWSNSRFLSLHLWIFQSISIAFQKTCFDHYNHNTTFTPKNIDINNDSLITSNFLNCDIMFYKFLKFEYGSKPDPDIVIDWCIFYISFNLLSPSLCVFFLTFCFVLFCYWYCFCWRNWLFCPWRVSKNLDFVIIPQGIILTC